MAEVDIVVIGAGIHGAGVAQAAAAAGYRVTVLEKNAVASGTSSKSSKLIHGGLRYLESYQFSLVRKALKERAILCRIAPGLVKLVPFYIPVYHNMSRRPWLIRLGLSLYAVLGGLHKENMFKRIRKNKIQNTDKLKLRGLKKVYQYFDGQTNDSDLTRAVMVSAKQLGAELLCPAVMLGIDSTDTGYTIKYSADGNEHRLNCKVVVNAAGPWANEIHKLVNINTNSLEIELVQGTHIIIDSPAPSGIYYLEAFDKRAVFVMPYNYNGKLQTMVGTTEKLYQGNPDKVSATEEEIDYLLDVYTDHFPEYQPVNLVANFAGLRVLPREEGSMFSRPRDTVLHWAAPGLLTLYGGKLTAYRSTAESVIKKIKSRLERKKRLAYTEQLLLLHDIE